MARYLLEVASALVVVELASALVVLICFSICASTPFMADTPAPIRIPTPGGEVILSNPAEHTAYDDWNYPPARRAGDYVYVSGVVVGRLAHARDRRKGDFLGAVRPNGDGLRGLAVQI